MSLFTGSHLFGIALYIVFLQFTNKTGLTKTVSKTAFKLTFLFLIIYSTQDCPCTPKQ